MNVSVCVTTKNEEGDIGKLLDSILNQSKKATEIVIVDSQSTDRTEEIIRDRQKLDKRIKLYLKKCTRGEGRNLAVKIAKNNIIAMTDAGCIAEEEWLARITRPFGYKQTDVVAGFYAMTAHNALQKTFSVFLGVGPKQYDKNFLPSTRSIAFRKKIWEKVGGFPEDIATAEDTVFNYKLLNFHAKFARVKTAVVEWGMPKTIKEFTNKIYEYARGDAKSKIYWNPVKKYESHNIKAVFTLFRYLVGSLLLIFGLSTPLLLWVLGVGIVGYFAFAYRKVFLEYRQVTLAILAIPIQIIADIAVINGYLTGVVE